jgi:hypothetical protein
LPLNASNPESAALALFKPSFKLPLFYEEKEEIQVETMAVKILSEGDSENKPDSGQPLTDGEILDYLQGKFLSRTSEALAVISCESGGDKDSISPTGDFGLFNINYSAHYKSLPGETKEEKITWILDPINNIDFAYSLYKEKKWGDWIMSENCWRPKFNLL